MFHIKTFAPLFTAAPLAGAFMQVAAAHPLESYDFSLGAYPYEDIAIEVIDLSDARAGHKNPDIYHNADRRCADGPIFMGPLISLMSDPPEKIREYLVNENGLSYKNNDDRSAANFIFGADGNLYDLRDPALFKRFMAGDLQSGQHVASPEFQKNLRTLALSCLPQI